MRLFILYLPLFLVSLFAENNSDVLKKKIKITSSNGMEIDSNGNQAIFNGDVILKQEDLILKCDQLIIIYRELSNGKKDIESLKGNGRVTCRQPSRKLIAESDTFFYNHKTGYMTFERSTGAVVIQEGNELRGVKIKINSKTGQVHSSGKTSIEINFDAL